MTSYEAGSAHLTILPSTRGFAKRLKAELAGVKQDVTVQAKVEVDRQAVDGLNKALQSLPIMVLDADSRPADREVAALRDRLAALSDQRIGIDISGDAARAEVAAIKESLAELAAPVVKIDADISEATEKADALKKRVTEMRKAIAADTPQVDLDIRAAEAKAATLRGRIEDLSAKESSPQVDLQIATAEAQLGRVTAQLDTLSAKKVSPEVRTDAAAAEAELAAVQASLTRLQAQRAEVEVHADTVGARAALEGVERALSHIDGQRVSAQAHVDIRDALASLGTLALGLAEAHKTVHAKVDLDVGAAVGRLAMITGGLLAVPALAGAAAYGIGAIGAALVPAAGAALLLPGAIAGAVVVVGALKVATSGVGDALKLAFDPSKAEQFAEALAKLSPEAQSAVRAVQGLSPALNAVKMAAQDALFDGVAPMITSLGGTYLPIVEERFARVGGAVNYAAGQLGGFLAGAYAVGLVKTIGDGAAGTFENLAMAVAPLAGAFLVVGSIAMPILEQITSGAGGVAGRLASWVGSAEGIQTITGWIYGALDVLRTLGGILANVGSIFGSLMSAASTAGGNFLTTLQMITGEVANFLSSAEGHTALVTLFSSIRGAVDAAMPGVRVILDALGYLITTLAPMLPAAGGAFSALVGAARPLFDLLVGLVSFALPPLLQMITDCPGLFIGLAIAVGIVSAAFSALKTITSIYAAVQAAMAIPAIATMVGATWGWVTALWAQAVAMVAAYWPILLIIAGIGLLIAAVIYAWNNFDWFRDAVTAVWDVIAAGATWLWTNVFQPVFSAIGAIFMWLWTSIISPVVGWIISQWSWLSIVIGILIGPIGWVVLAFTTFRDQTMAVLSAVGNALLWLWQNVFVLAWNAIAAVVTWAWTNIIWPVLSALGVAFDFLGRLIFALLVFPFVLAWQLISAAVSAAWTGVLQPIWYGAIVPALQFLGAVFTWLYANVVLPIWNAIGAAISFVWNSIILPIWNAIIWYVNNVTIPAMQFLYYGVILPIWNAIGAAISFVWNSIILPIWNALVWVINNVLIPAVNFLYYNVIKPVWDAIGAAIMWVWTNVINPAFNAVWGGLQWLGDRFRDGVGFIQRVWDTIRGILARPINFMINTVWNNGILTAWNKVAGLVGIPAIAPLAPIAEMATGGPVRGPGSGTSDDVPIWASNGEFMVREKIATRAAPFLAALNSGDGEALQAAGATRAGRSARFHGTSGIGKQVNGYRDGGPIFASGRGVWGSVGRYAMGGPIEERINAAKSWLSGPARGIPYVWGGGSMSGMDCSGMQAAVTHILSGRAPTSGRIGTTASMPWGGFQGGINGQYAVGNKPSDHMAGTLAGQNVEQHGPSGTPFAFPSRWGADNGYFPQKYHLGEAGGSFVSGGAGGGGSWFNPLPGLVRAAFSLTDIPLKLFKGLVGDPPPEYRRIPVGLAYKVRDTLRDFVVQKAELAGPSDGMDTSGIVGPVQDQVRQVAQRFGWDQGPEWDSIVRIVQKESSWNPGAASPVSSARGLFQKMTSLNGPVEPTPAGQAAWGLNYIKGRYGTPSRAWAWHQSHNWYDDGGIAYGRGLMLKNTDDPERILPPQETQAYPTLTRLTQQLEAGRVPTSSLAGGAAQARAASLGAATGGALPSEMRLSGGQLRILGPDLVEIVDGRLELVADKLTDGRMGP